MSWPLIAVMIKAKRIITTEVVAVLNIFVFCEEKCYFLLSNLTLDLCFAVDLLLLPDLLFLLKGHKYHVNIIAETLAFQQWDIVESARQMSLKVSWGGQTFMFACRFASYCE